MSGKDGMSVQILGIALLANSLAFTASLGGVSARKASRRRKLTFAEQPEAPRSTYSRYRARFTSTSLTPVGFPS